METFLSLMGKKFLFYFGKLQQRLKALRSFFSTLITVESRCRHVQPSVMLEMFIYLSRGSTPAIIELCIIIMIFALHCRYCNTRVMKFDANGKLLKKWGNPSLGIEVPPANAFYIPHSVTLVEDKKEVCVADRENGRVQCFDYDGKFLRKLKPKEIGDRLFAISYSPKAGELVFSF